MTTSAVQRAQQLYVGGEWRDGEAVVEVADLADGGTFAQVAAAGTGQAEAALSAAADAEHAMRETTVVERANWLESLADAVEARSEALAEIIVREAGKPIGSARSEVSSAVERLHRAAAEARDLTGEYREGSTAGHEGWQAVVKPEPVGCASRRTTTRCRRPCCRWRRRWRRATPSSSSRRRRRRSARPSSRKPSRNWTCRTARSTWGPATRATSVTTSPATTA